MRRFLCLEFRHQAAGIRVRGRTVQMRSVKNADRIVCITGGVFKATNEWCILRFMFDRSGPFFRFNDSTIQRLTAEAQACAKVVWPFLTKWTVDTSLHGQKVPFKCRPKRLALTTLKRKD